MRLEEINGLKAPESFVNATSEEKKEVINSCGPDGFINHLVPNHLLSLSVEDSCAIHDWTFAKAKNQKDHAKSDLLFLENLKAQVRRKESNFLIKHLRYGLAYIYFGAVRIYSFLTKNTSQSDEKKDYKP
ncbi:MAG: hypothetical protein HRT44_07840 [Bdellovibrionales bacterium]|nr:hypothetical protein [Bdellovibrionales bacterium]NQZ19150.1 hypothetical protein [Bdellovibrionales bacterium]